MPFAFDQQVSRHTIPCPKMHASVELIHIHLKSHNCASNIVLLVLLNVKGLISALLIWRLASS